MRHNRRHNHFDVISVDRNYLPMGACSRRAAIKAVATGRAQALDLRTWGKVGEMREIDWAAVKVIVFHLSTACSDVRLGLGKGTKAILRRDRHRCAYCGRKAGTADHIIPRCQGGETKWTNLVAACLRCNQAKGGRTPEQADMKLLFQPLGPRAHLYVAFEALVKASAA